MPESSEVKDRLCLLGLRRKRRRRHALPLDALRLGKPLAQPLRLGLQMSRQGVEEIGAPQAEGGVKRDLDVPEIERLLQKRSMKAKS
jgi:hypothetical protein